MESYITRYYIAVDEQAELTSSTSCVQRYNFLCERLPIPVLTAPSVEQLDLRQHFIYVAQQTDTKYEGKPATLIRFY